MDIVLLVALGALLLFFMFNSRRRQKAQQEKLSTGLVPGAQVMTTFGMFGEVVDVDDDGIKVTIETTPGTRLTVHKQAIGQIEPPAAAAADPATEPEKDNYAGGTYGGTPEDYASGNAKSADDSKDDRKRITDEELDKMIEEKRKKQDSDDA